MGWQCGRQAPGQEFMDAVDRMIGDALKDVAQVKLRIKTVELRGASLNFVSCIVEGEIRNRSLTASLRFCLHPM